MIKINIRSTQVILAKAFKAEEGATLAAEIVSAVGDLVGRRVAVIDHPPTQGLVPLIEGLMAAGAEVSLRDHHGDSDRDGSIVARCREILGERAVIVTRIEHPACSTLVEVGEFAGDIIVADADQDGSTSALKAAGVWYPEGDADAAVLDGPASGKTEEALSPLGFSLVRAWGAIPAFNAPGRDAVFVKVVEAFASTVQGEQAGVDALVSMAVEYERKVASAQALAATATEPFSGFRLLDVPAGAEFDGPTLATELDRGGLVSARIVSTGPIAGKPGGFGSQVSLARTKAGEQTIDLAALTVQAFGERPEGGWKPESGVISNTPFLLHLSPERWEAFRPILEAALGK